MELLIHKRISAQSPVMLAGWPGMGNVAIGTMDYLRRKLSAKPFAEIDVSKTVTPDMIIVEEGLIKLSRPPKNIFYYQEIPDLIIFEGETQLREVTGAKLMEHILDLARELKVRRIFTAAAFPLPMSYKEEPKVYGVANTKSFRDILYRQYNLRIMESGQISGLNGLLLGFAQKRGIEAACLLATMPLYAVNLPNLRASRAIIEVLQKILKIRIDLDELDLRIQGLEREMSELEEGIKEGLRRESPLELFQKEGEVPGYVKKKIEKLFQEARQDRSRAYTLKRELDKWHLFENYEDRFLDLFKDHH